MPPGLALLSFYDRWVIRKLASDHGRFFAWL